MTFDFTAEQLAVFQNLEKQRKTVQNTQTMPLIKPDYIASGRVYYNSAGGLIQALEFENEISPEFLKSIIGRPMNERISVNLTFQSPGINLSLLDHKVDVISLVSEFFETTGTMCTCIQNKRIDRPEEDDQVLVCHGVDHTAEEPDIGSQDPAVHKLFYGFLIAKDILEPVDLELTNHFSEEELCEIVQTSEIFRDPAPKPV